jgi:Tfp pilus assembly protein PilF
LARDKFLSGDFEGAAVAYEKLLSSGGDPGLTNQRLAQCYEKLGRKSEAKEAYRRAIAAFEAKGNQDALETCRQALKVLGG